MPKKQPQSTQVVEAEAEPWLGQLPEEAQQEWKLLRGFRDLVGERWGYFIGRRITQEEMNEATKEERKAVTEIRKAITGENLEQLITEGDISTYKEKQKAIKEAREVVSKKAEPFREKIAPLRKAQKYLDTVAIPDSLKELGTPVEPAFKLSEWIEKTLKAEKANR